MYIIENNRSIRSISIVRKEGHMSIVRFDDSGGGMRISENRIFNSKEEAEIAVGIKRKDRSFLGPWKVWY